VRRQQSSFSSSAQRPGQAASGAQVLRRVCAARDHSAILLTRVLSAGSWPRPLSSQASPPASIFQLVLCPATKVLAEILGFECAAATESLQLCSFRLFVFCSLYKLLIVLSCYRLLFLFFWIAYGLLHVEVGITLESLD
jgi:hypothetical protein